MKLSRIVLPLFLTTPFLTFSSDFIDLELSSHSMEIKGLPQVAKTVYKSQLIQKSPRLLLLGGATATSIALTITASSFPLTILAGSATFMGSREIAKEIREIAQTIKNSYKENT